MFSHVTVPLDGSAFAEFALPLAVDVARRSGARLELVTVQETLGAYTIGGRQKQIAPWREEYLRAVADRYLRTLDEPPRRTLLAGRVAQQLERHARSAGSDLLVLSTHGRGPLSRFWIGSVADHLMRRALCPVLLVRPEEGEDPHSRDEVELPVILVPLDGSEHAEGVLGPALEMARLFGSGVVLVRVVRYPSGLTSTFVPNTAAIAREIVEKRKREAREYLEEVADELETGGDAVELSVRVDAHPVSGIRNAIRDRSAGLVAVSTRGSGGVGRALLGSVADKLVRSSPAPVLVRRPEPGGRSGRGTGPEAEP